MEENPIQEEFQQEYLPDVLPQSPQDILNMFQQPGFYDISFLKGLVETVTTIPTYVPTRVEQQIKFYVDSVTNPTVKRLYVYSNRTNTWQYADMSGGTSYISKSFTAGESLSANDAVFVASGNIVSSNVSQATQDSSAAVWGNNRYCQTFQTSSTAGSIISLTLYLGNPAAQSSSLNIYIYATSGGQPTGSALGTIATNQSVISSAGEYTFAFTSPVAVSGSTTYAIVLSTPLQGVGGYTSWYYKNSNVYANGSYGYSGDAGATWTMDTGKDFYFKANESSYYPGKVYKAVTSSDDEKVLNFVGFATSAVSAGDSCSVKVVGVVSGFTDLTPGSGYYLSSSSGLISTTKTYPGQVGVAISSTEILIKKGSDIFTVTASDNLKYSADTERTTTSASYSKIKEIQVSYTGVVRVKYDQKTDNPPQIAYGKIYINDVATSYENTNNTSTYQTRSNDVQIRAGDKVQLYFNMGGGGTCYIRNFRIYYDKGVAIESNGVITD